MGMDEEKRCSLSCDEVMAVYLREVSQKVNEEFYQDVLKFMLCFRECLNKYGWQKLQEYQ